MTDREALIQICNYLWEGNPCCSCCDSDGSYSDAQLFAENVANSVGLSKIEIKHFQCHAKFNPHPARHDKCPDCKSWSTFEFKE